MTNWREAARDVVQLLTDTDYAPRAALADVQRVAQANQLLYALGGRWGGTAFELLQQRAAGTAYFVMTLLPRFEAAQLPFMTLKSFLPFPYVDSNVDVVALSPELGAYTAVVTASGFVRQWTLADVREPDKKMYRPVGQPEGVPRCHLHTAVSWNGVPYLDLAGVWAARQPVMQYDTLLAVPCPSDELLIMAAHALFENKYVSLHELVYLAHLLRQGVDWRRVWRTAAAFNWTWGLRQWLAIVQALADGVGLAVALPQVTAVTLPANWYLPYLLPPRVTFGAGGRKLAADVRQGRVRWLPRQIFSYTAVDAVWMYRKAWRTCRRGWR